MPGMHERARTKANIKILKYQHVLIVLDMDNEQLGCHLPLSRNSTVFSTDVGLCQATVLIKPTRTAE